MFNIRPSWNISFTSVIKILRLGGKIIPANTGSFRAIADLEVPHWTPTLPSGIKCVKSDIEMINGEWIYPESITNIKKHSKYILYIQNYVVATVVVLSSSILFSEAFTSNGE